jgi:hypothetical protein
LTYGIGLFFTIHCPFPVETTDQILALLIAERDKLNAAISVLGGTPAKRRGRPPKSASMPDWVNGNGTAPKLEKPATKKKRNFSPAQRKAAADRMRKMWAAKKKAAKK